MGLATKPLSLVVIDSLKFRLSGASTARTKLAGSQDPVYKDSHMGIP